MYFGSTLSLFNCLCQCLTLSITVRNLTPMCSEHETANLIVVTVLITTGYKVSGLKFYKKRNKAIPVLSNYQPICVKLVSGNRQSEGTKGQITGHIFEKYMHKYMCIYMCVKMTFCQEREEFLFLLQTLDCYCGCNAVCLNS